MAVRSVSNNVLCSRRAIPCSYFSFVEHAIFLPPTDELQDLIREKFNFAIFVLHLSQVISKWCDPDLIISRTLRYRFRNCIHEQIDINQRDPRTGQTALHYACIHTHWLIIHCLLEYPDVDTDKLDFFKLPPEAYYPIQYFPSSDESKARSLLVQKSTKLFYYVFEDEEPDHWNSSVLAICNTQVFTYLTQEQVGKIIRGIRDNKGNTLLHYAAKMNKICLIEFILRTDDSAQNIRNKKRKLPIHYCRTNESLNRFRSDGFFHRNSYINTETYGRGVNNSVMYILYYFQNILTHYPFEREFICSNLSRFVFFMLHLHDQILKPLSKVIRDACGNTLFHVIAQTENLENKLERYQKLDPLIINIRNVFGNTCLHESASDEDKRLLISLGAHPDCLNYQHEVAIQKLNPETSLVTEFMMCSLQCLAARKVDIVETPHHLKEFVQLHHPNPVSN